MTEIQSELNNLNNKASNLMNQIQILEL
jgi:hypothetical protein